MSVIRKESMCSDIGRALVEKFNKEGKGQILQEKYGTTFKEDANTTTNAGMFTTVMADTLYQAAVNDARVKEILGLVEINSDLMNMNGAGALKLPLDQPTIAVEVGEGGDYTRFSDGTDFIIATPRKVVAGTVVTWEIAKRGISDTLTHMLNKGVAAISRKLATDVVDGLAAGALAGNTVTGGIDYNAVIDAETNVNDAAHANGVKFGFLSDKLVIASAQWGPLQKDTDWKNHVYRAGGKPGDLVINMQSLIFGNLDIIVTPFLSGAQAMVMDSLQAGTLVKEADLETFQQPVSGRPYDEEVVGLMSYTVIVKYPAAIAKITA